MRRILRRAVLMCLTAMLAGGGLACANDKYDSRSASVTAAASADVLTLYTDDTCVIYTVTTPVQCVKVYLQQLADGTDKYGEPLLLGEKAFSRDTEGVSVTEAEGKAVWTIPCDFGACGVSGVRVKAQAPMGGKADYLYTNVDLHIDYPHFDADTLAAAYQGFVTRNEDAPYYFTVDPADEALVKEGLSAFYGEDTDYESRARAVVTDYGFLYPDSGTPVIETAARSDIFPGMLAPKGRLLVRLYIPNDDFTACYEGAGLRVSDSARAILLSAAGKSADAALYPVAALMQEKARAWLGEMPLEEFTDAERARVAYERVCNLGVTALPPDGFMSLPDAERAYYERTAYGLFSGFGGASQGYADAFYLLCGLAGVPCVKLPCAAIGGERDYCVNAVLLGDEWCIVDACGALEGMKTGGDMYARFGLSGEQAADFYAINAPELRLSASTAYNIMPAAAEEAP